MTFRILHRYLGFFLAGIMMVYAVSGITLIFRKTDTFKVDTLVEKEVDLSLGTEELARVLRIKGFEIQDTVGAEILFAEGRIDLTSGMASYTAKKLPVWLDKITHLHKATTEDPLYYFNIFFGAALLFFAVSAFFMFLPKTPIFKKGLWFTLGGIVLMIIMLSV